jgi:hypothetical protein
MSTWYVTDRHGNEVSHVSGESKVEARDHFCKKMRAIRGDDILKPWKWWKNQGFKLRRRPK